MSKKNHELTLDTPQGGLGPIRLTAGNKCGTERRGSICIDFTVRRDDKYRFTGGQVFTREQAIELYEWLGGHVRSWPEYATPTPAGEVRE